MIVRDRLSNNQRGKKLIDMEKVYRKLDLGMRVDEVASEWGVSARTLYRRHHEYQALARIMEEENIEEDGILPPLPEDLP